MQNKINNIIDKMSIKYIIANNINTKLLEQSIRRYISNELKGYNNIQFTSYDIRRLTSCIKNIHKKLNNLIDFSQFRKRFNKYNKISSKELKIEVTKVAEYMRCARDLQEIYSKLCYDEIILEFIEMQHQQNKEENEKLLCNAILEGLKESYEI